MRYVCVLLLILTATLFALAQEKSPPPRTENVIVVTLDGFRWQELFRGADEALMDKKSGGVRDVEGLKSRYGRATPEERRAALLPFFWGTLAKQGQVFGDRSERSVSRLTN